jgi:hypothetical protein
MVTLPRSAGHPRYALQYIRLCRTANKSGKDLKPTSWLSGRVGAVAFDSRSQMVGCDFDWDSLRRVAVGQVKGFEARSPKTKLRITKVDRLEAYATTIHIGFHLVTPLRRREMAIGITFGITEDDGPVRKTPDRAVSRTNEWSRRRESNPQPAVYKTAALPLSYVGQRVQRVYSIVPWPVCGTIRYQVVSVSVTFSSSERASGTVNA